MNKNIEKLAFDLNNTKSSDLLEPSMVGKVLAEHLPSILQDRNLLTDEQKVYSANEPYTKHIVYTCDDWSLQALVWKPNGATSIHNHKCWCTVGVYQGEIVEERFKDINDDVALCCETVVHKKGVFASLIPDGNDIHRMLNKTDVPAITLHFYGINAFKEPSSILQVFTEV